MGPRVGRLLGKEKRKSTRTYDKNESGRECNSSTLMFAWDW